MIKILFPTQVYFSKLKHKNLTKLNRELLSEIEKIHEMDGAGQKWSAQSYVAGYTSYGSISHLHWMSSTFEDLQKSIDAHVKQYVKTLGFKIGKSRIWMNSCWVNVMPKYAHHSFHIHPLSFVSGTYYVQVPKKTSCIKFEDPRLVNFMGSPARECFYELTPAVGHVVLFESWLRHEVPAHTSPHERISISFNYSWEH